ncbi:hypothetical protein TKK_0017006 [Trichogramma kaykai]|uniref:BED-type domain-containing protein n=1 Tax=Trichogramma kaykai TaxID=54128 RepID=A0ABD2W5Q5_9HYME
MSHSCVESDPYSLGSAITSVVPFQSDPTAGDERRLKIYLSFDQEEPSFCIENLTLQDYLKLKHNDEFTYEYCRRNLVSETYVIRNLFRSLDTVKYEVVKIPEVDLEQNTSQEHNNTFDSPNNFEDVAITYEENSNVYDSVEKQISNENIDENKSDNTADAGSGKIVKASIIWDHVHKSSDSLYLICNYCSKKIKNCANTSNTLKHLRIHPLFVDVLSHKSQNIKTDRKRKLNEDNCTIPKKKNPGIKEAFEKIHSFKGNGVRSDSIMLSST